MVTCAACAADLAALATRLAAITVIEAECCAYRVEILGRIDRILDGDHDDTAAEEVI